MHCADGLIRRKTVLISGASIAGPALAFWLAQYGYQVTIVEKAPEVRRGGQAVDFKGAAHRTVLHRMGILDAVRAASITGNKDGVIVDANGRKVATVPAAFSSGEIEILRGDLAHILYELTTATCEYIFEDTISSLRQAGDGVDVTFQRAAARTFDLVVGADGIHSNVRRLTFGPEADYVHHLGYYYALAELKHKFNDEESMYNEPGRMVMTGGDKAPAFFVFASHPLQYERDNVSQQKDLLARVYRGGGWKVPDLIESLPGASEFYMDSISRVTMDRYAEGRVVLLGDAAYGCSLGGFGTGLAVVGAYVLAGELHRAGGDYRVAYAQYEDRIRGYAKVSQKVNAGRLLAPPTRLGMFMRNKLFSAAGFFHVFLKLIDYFASDIDLEDYATKS